MTKAAQLRAALAGGPLTKDELQKRVDFELTLAPSQYGLATAVIEGVKHWALQAGALDDVTRTPKGGKKSKRKQRLKGFRAMSREKKAGTVKSYKQLRRALKAPARPAIADLARDNYLATQDQLISVIQERVAGLHDDEVIAPLLAAHQRARQLYQAAQS